MITQKVQHCIKVAISNERIKQAIQQREEHPNFWLFNINAKIIRKGKTETHNQMIVRVGFDFSQRFENFEVKEDILVDVSYSENRNTGKNEYKILNAVFVPEI